MYDRYNWFPLNISAMCSFSHSISFRAEKANSSTSCSTNAFACALSSKTHCREPTSAGFDRGAAMFVLDDERWS